MTGVQQFIHLPYDLFRGTEGLVSHYLLLCAPRGGSEGFYVIVGDFGVYAVEILLPPPLECGAGGAAHLGGWLDEVGVAVTPVGFL